MSISDPISDMLTRMRNAVMMGHALVAMPSSQIKVAIAKIMKEEGYIGGYEVVDGKVAGSKVLRIRLKYVGERRETAFCDHRNGTHQPAWSSCIHRQDGNPMGTFRYGHCDSFHPQGRDDWSACSSVGSGGRDPLQGLVRRKLCQELDVCRLLYPKV